MEEKKHSVTRIGVRSKSLSPTYILLVLIFSLFLHSAAVIRKHMICYKFFPIRLHLRYNNNNNSNNNNNNSNNNNNNNNNNLSISTALSWTLANFSVS
jgi:hypothetical protein